MPHSVAERALEKARQERDDEITRSRHEIDARFIERVRQITKEHEHLTREAVADALGMSRSNLQVLLRKHPAREAQ